MKIERIVNPEEFNAQGYCMLIISGDHEAPTKKVGPQTRYRPLLLGSLARRQCASRPLGGKPT